MSNHTQLFASYRTQLFFDHPFYGSLFMHLKPVATTSIDTMRTDAQSLWYNPDFLATLSAAEAKFVLAHETAHCAYLHPFRRKGRDPLLWNVACDYVINQMLVRDGLTPIKGCLLDARFADMSSEAVYAKLMSEQQAPRPEPGNGQDSNDGDSDGHDGPSKAADGQGNGEGTAGGDMPGPAESMVPGQASGDFVDAPEQVKAAQGEGASQVSEEMWQVAVEQAVMVAQRAGNMPGGASQALATTKDAGVDWASVTKEFIVRHTPSDYAWTNPNRRLITRGLYMPGVVKENVGDILLVVDCSGSTSRMLQTFSNEFAGILSEARPERVHIIYHDSIVQSYEELHVDEFDEIKFTAKGFGGTCTVPVLKYVEDNGINPVAAIWLTDLEFFDKPEEPSYPVLFATPDYVRYSTPGWGEHIKIPDEKGRCV